MEFRNLTNEEFMLYNNMVNGVVIAGKTFHNLTVLLCFINPFVFKVLYSENGFNSHTEHIYSNLKDAFEDFENAYAIEV